MWFRKLLYMQKEVHMKQAPGKSKMTNTSELSITIVVKLSFEYFKIFSLHELSVYQTHYCTAHTATTTQ